MSIQEVVVARLIKNTSLLFFCAFGSIAHVNASVINVQPILVCSNDGRQCAETADLYINETNKIFSQIGASVSYNPLETMFSDVYLNISNAGTKAAALTQLSVKSAVDQSYQMLIVDSYYGGYGVASVFGGGMIVSDDIFSKNRVDTIAHELGHLMGFDHTSDDIPAFENYLMAEGTTRNAANSLDDINPDGLKLDRFALPTVVASAQLDASATSYFDIDFSSGAGSGESLTAIKISLSGTNGYFDIEDVKTDLAFQGLSQDDISNIGISKDGKNLAIALNKGKVTQGAKFRILADVGTETEDPNISKWKANFVFSDGTSYWLDDAGPNLASVFDLMQGVGMPGLYEVVEPFERTVPEPGTYILLCTGLLWFLTARSIKLFRAR